MISSKQATEFREFPMPKHYPMFPSARQVLDYLTDYIKHFKLDEQLKYNCKVLWIDPVTEDENNILPDLSSMTAEEFDTYKRKRAPNYPSLSPIGNIYPSNSYTITEVNGLHEHHFFFFCVFGM
jgi:hypothetical protein